MNFEINPKIGIGPVKLGMSRDEIKSILGEQSYSGSNGESDYYYENSLQVEFTDNLASFIGASYSGEYSVTYRGANVFNTEASKLFRLIAINESETHEYDPSEYVFPEQILTLWDADEQYDYTESEKRVIWAQIGAGSQTYLDAINEIS